MIEVDAHTATGDVRYRLRSLSESRQAGLYKWTVHWPGWQIIDPLALDLLEISKAVFLADRAVRRSLNFGQRTRGIRLSVPVLRGAVWRRAKPLLESLARFASSDSWRLEFTPAQSRQPAGRKPERPTTTATVVALFSGGLDSLCGAAYLAGNKESPIFVNHSPPGRETCSSLVKRVWTAFERDDLTDDQCLTFRLEVRERIGGVRSMFQEPTRRTRPFFFLGLACAAALNARIRSVQMSENGAFALSLPIRADAYGAMCSRQAHAYLIHGFQELLNLISPAPDGWRVYNPFDQMTKGEACQLLGRASSLTNEAVSCEYVGRQAASLWAWKRKHPRWAREIGNGPQCGVCVPCLVRRAALHKARVPDPVSGYFFDARRVHDWDAVSPQSCFSGNARWRPPLYDIAAPHVYHVRNFCERLRRMTPSEFIVQYLPELRLPQTHDSHSDETLRQYYQLVLRFASELQEFLDS